jgi:hypothetical protein
MPLSAPVITAALPASRPDPGSFPRRGPAAGSSRRSGPAVPAAALADSYSLLLGVQGQASLQECTGAAQGRKNTPGPGTSAGST